MEKNIKTLEELTQQYGDEYIAGYQACLKVLWNSSFYQMGVDDMTDALKQRVRRHWNDLPTRVEFNTMINMTRGELYEQHNCGRTDTDSEGMPW